MTQLTQPIVQGTSRSSTTARAPFETGTLLKLAPNGEALASLLGLPENHRLRTIRVIPRSLHEGDEELTPALRLNRGVVASRYANLFTEPLGV